MTTLHEEIERAELQMEYGEGKWPCALCGQIRDMVDLARCYVRDDYFMLCHGFLDTSPTCYEKYQAGREANKAKRRG